MGEYSSFFGGTAQDPRQYDQTQFAEVLSRLFKTGIFPNVGNELLVSETDPPRLAVAVGLGQAWINGYWYKNDAIKELDLPAADPTYPRIHRIVLRLDTVDQRNIIATVKQGTASAQPNPPALQQDDQVYEISLAQVYVGPAVTSVSDMDITDERGAWAVPYDTPLHASTHASEGDDPIAPGDIGAETPAGAQSKATAAQNAAINWAKGFGLGTEAKSISAGTDVDDLNATGFYYGVNLINAPSDDNFAIVHIQTSLTSATQMALCVYGAEKGNTFFRTEAGDTWTSWIKVADDAAVVHKAEATLDGMVFGGAFTGQVNMNTDYNGTPNDGEIQITPGTFVHPNGHSDSVDAATVVITFAEDATITERYIVYVGSDFSRFEEDFADNPNASRKFVAAVYEGGEWKFDTNGFFRAFTPNANDAVIARVKQKDGTSGFDEFQNYRVRTLNIEENGTGIISIPQQSYVAVGRGYAAGGFSVPSGTTPKLQFNTVNQPSNIGEDHQNEWDSASDSIKFKESGVYLFSCHVSVSEAPINSGNFWFSATCVSGPNAGKMAQILQADDQIGLNMTGSTATSFQKDDVIELQIYNGTSQNLTLPQFGVTVAKIQ